MIVIKPQIFNQTKNVGFGFSTRKSIESKPPFYFNLSFSVGDESGTVQKNRKKFFDYLGIDENSVAFQKQVHGDKITLVDSPGSKGESDALITDQKNLGLAITSADCCAIFIYDSIKEIIAAVHSGWRGTSKKILFKTIEKMKTEFYCDPGNFFCYLSPSISQQNYEVGREVAEQFNEKYLNRIDSKFYLDIKSANYDMLIEHGVKSNQIQVSQLCSYGYESLLHSYRRDGKNSGRALGVIFMKENK